MGKRNPEEFDVSARNVYGSRSTNDTAAQVMIFPLQLGNMYDHLAVRKHKVNLLMMQHITNCGAQNTFFRAYVYDCKGFYPVE